MTISVVIGAGTTVAFGDANACIVSVNWGFNPGRTDAFCLGDFSPNADYVIYKPTQTLSLTGYAPVQSAYSIPPSETCEDASKIEASVSPAICDGIDAGGIDGDWWVQSYNYSKETKDQPGQETWSLIKYKDGPANFLTSQGVPSDRIAEPSYVMRGITMGESTEPTGSETGIQFDEVFAEAQTGSVSAGGFGKVSVIDHGSVTAVGGGSSDAGFKGTGSASIPYTPLYI